MQSPRSKGEQFEHKVCQLLNKRFSKKFYKDISNLLEDSKACGDIAAPIDFRFSIDCRSGYDTTTISDLFKKGSQLSKFWKQCCAKAEKLGLEPMMVWQHDYRETFIVLDINQIPANMDAVICHSIGVGIVNFNTMLREAADIYWFAS